MKRGIYYLMLVLAGFTAASCNKQLDITPIDQISDNNFWQTEKDLDAAVAGGYALLRKAFSDGPTASASDINVYHPRFYMYGDRRGLIFKSYTTDPVNGSTDANLKRNRLRTEMGGAREWDSKLFDWTAFYQVIVQCNTILENANRIPESEFIRSTRANYIAEARFIRAFTYFYIVRVWGDVPFMTKSKVTDKLGRTEADKVLDFAQQELLDIENILPLNFNNANQNSIRVTKGTVQATLAHLYAWRQQPAQTIDYVNRVLGGGVYKFLTFADSNAVKTMTPDAVAKAKSDFIPRYREIFKGYSQETVFEIDFAAATGEFGANGSLANMTLFGTRLTNGRAQPYWALNAMKVGDPNDAQNTRTFQNGTAKQFFPDTTNDLRYVAFFEKGVAPTNMNGEVFTKYAWVVDASRNLFEANIVVFRTADLILLRAEAYAKMNNFNAARADLNWIRFRAYLKPFAGADSELKLEVFRERTKELLGEGHYYYDLVRTRLLTDPDYAKLPCRPDVTPGDFTDGAWTWPVSNKAFTDNPNMQQLRYWQRY